MSLAAILERARTMGWIEPPNSVGAKAEDDQHLEESTDCGKRCGSLSHFLDLARSKDWLETSNSVSEDNQTDDSLGKGFDSSHAHKEIDELGSLFGTLLLYGEPESICSNTEASSTNSDVGGSKLSSTVVYPKDGLETPSLPQTEENKKLECKSASHSPIQRKPLSPTNGRTFTDNSAMKEPIEELAPPVHQDEPKQVWKREELTEDWMNLWEDTKEKVSESADTQSASRIISDVPAKSSDAASDKAREGSARPSTKDAGPLKQSRNPAAEPKAGDSSGEEGGLAMDREAALVRRARERKYQHVSRGDHERSENEGASRTWDEDLLRWRDFPEDYEFPRVGDEYGSREKYAHWDEPPLSSWDEVDRGSKASSRYAVDRPSEEASEVTVVVDTNCLIHELPALKELHGMDGVSLVIPFVVGRELDQLKLRGGELAQASRAGVKWLLRALDGGRRLGSCRPQGTGEWDWSIPQFNADDSVLSCAAYFQRLGRPVCLATGDLGLQLKAMLIAMEAVAVGRLVENRRKRDHDKHRSRRGCSDHRSQRGCEHRSHRDYDDHRSHRDYDEHRSQRGCDEYYR